MCRATAIADTAIPFDFGGSVSPDLTTDGITAHLDTQRTMMRDFTTAHGIPIVDITPALREFAADGETPYCFTDTHWCEMGHEIVRSVLRDRLLTTSTIR